MKARAIAVVGPGRMGVGIATAVLMAGRGHRVLLVDTKKRDSGQKLAALHRAQAEVKENLALLRELGVGTVEPDELLCDLRLTHGLSEEIADCSFVFEALPEVADVKRALYTRIEPLIDESAVLVSATSTFDLRVFWGMCSRPENVIVAHWLNPAFLIPLVEVAYGERTSPHALQMTQGFLQDLGKITVTLRSSPGFVVPRIQAAAMNEAVRILEEGVTTAEQIDTAIKAGFGFRLGVLGLLEFIDLGGVDILAHAGEYLAKALGQSHFKPPRAVVQKMERGETGPRTGRGFYDYAGIDTKSLFRDRYRGFVELLRLYEQSSALRFAGGIESEKEDEP